MFQTAAGGFCDCVYFLDDLLETGLYTGIEQIDSKSLGKFFNFLLKKTSCEIGGELYDFK